MDAGTTMPIEGSWSEPRPRGPEFADDPVKTKIAFKLAYRQRSQFLHAGERTVNFVRDAFSETGALQEADRAGTGGKPYLSMAQLRAALRSLILRELADHGDPDPKGLDEIIFVTTPHTTGIRQVRQQLRRLIIQDRSCHAGDWSTIPTSTAFHRSQTGYPRRTDDASSAGRLPRTASESQIG